MSHTRPHPGLDRPRDPKAARERGWRLDYDWFTDNPLRRHRARPAIQGEAGRSHPGQFPAAIVCVELRWLERFTFCRRIVPASADTVNAFRDDCGEAIAKAFFELSERVPEELVSLGTDGRLYSLTDDANAYVYAERAKGARL